MNRNLAIVVGHNASARGAVRKDTGETEYEFNGRIAELMEDYARRYYPELETRVFRRVPMGSYTREINRVYDEVDAWGAHLSIELHFNSAGDPRATGTETLTSGTPASMAAAVAVNDAVVAALGLRDRGVKTRRSGRGSQSLMSGRAPAILVEPFFGSSETDLGAVGEPDQERALAAAYVKGAARALQVMPRQDLAESRTLRDAGRTKAASRVGSLATATSIGGFSLDKSGLLDVADVAERFDLAAYLPHLIFGGMGVALLVLVIIPAWQDWIAEHRADDHRRFNGS